MTTVVAAGGPGAVGFADTVVGTSRHATLTFRMPAGARATSLSVPGLHALPPGWSTATPDFSCAEVRDDDACALTLRYAPATPTASTAAMTAASARAAALAVARALTLTLDYRYTDAAGTLRHASASLDYSARAANAVAATVSPTGTLQARVGQASQATIAFVTSDGSTATDLTVTSSLTSLPSGWSAPATMFQCPTVSTAGCSLTLTYLPAASAAGALALQYAYTDNAGAAQTGTATVHYTATTAGGIATSLSRPDLDDTRVGGSETVTVTFEATGGNPVSDLAVPLSSLPLGWSAAAQTFSCSTVSSGSACQLTLTWTPQQPVAASTLSLPFTFTDNFGGARTGSVSVGYRAIPRFLVGAGGNGPVGVTQLGPNGLFLAMTYHNHGASIAQSVAIHGNNLYVGTVSELRHCTPAGGIPSACSTMPALYPLLTMAVSPDGRVLAGSDINSAPPQLCQLLPTGQPVTCRLEPMLSPSYTTAFHGSRIYAGQFDAVTHCAIYTDSATVGDCRTQSIGQPWPIVALAFQGQFAWLAAADGNLQRCSLTASGALAACSAIAQTLPVASLVAKDWRLYVGLGNNAGIAQFDIDRTTGELSNRRDMAANLGMYTMIGVD